MTVSTFYTLVRFYQPDLVDFKQGNLVHWIRLLLFIILLFFIYEYTPNTNTGQQLIYFFCGADRDRTCDLFRAREALSQLSYSPNHIVSRPPRTSIARAFPCVRYSSEVGRSLLGVTCKLPRCETT